VIIKQVRFLYTFTKYS